MKKQSYLIVGLIVILVVAIAVIVIMQTKATYDQKLQEKYLLGIDQGYEIAVKQLMDQLVTCEPVPVHAGNFTLNAIAVECLQQK